MHSDNDSIAGNRILVSRRRGPVGQVWAGQAQAGRGGLTPVAKAARKAGYCFGKRLSCWGFAPCYDGVFSWPMSASCPWSQRSITLKGPVVCGVRYEAARHRGVLLAMSEFLSDFRGSVEAHQAWFNFAGHLAGIQQRNAMLRQMERASRDQLRTIGELQRINQTESQRLQIEKKRLALESARLEYEKAESKRAEMRRQQAQEITRCLAESLVAAEWLKPRTSSLALGRPGETIESLVRCLAALQTSAGIIEESLGCLEQLDALKHFYELRRTITECLEDLQRAAPDRGDPLQHVLQQLQQYENFFARARDVRTALQGELRQLADLSAPLTLKEIQRRQAESERLASSLLNRVRTACRIEASGDGVRDQRADIHPEILSIAVCQNWQHSVPPESSTRDRMLRFAAGEGPWAEELLGQCRDVSAQMAALELTWQQHRDAVVGAERLAMQWHYRSAAGHLRAIGVLSRQDPPVVIAPGFADIAYSHALDRILAAFHKVQQLTDLKTHARLEFADDAKRRVESQLHNACLIEAPRQSELYADVARLKQEVQKALLEAPAHAPSRSTQRVPPVAIGVLAACCGLVAAGWCFATGSAVAILVVLAIAVAAVVVWAVFDDGKFRDR